MPASRSIIACSTATAGASTSMHSDGGADADALAPAAGAMLEVGLSVRGLRAHVQGRARPGKALEEHPHPLQHVRHSKHGAVRSIYAECYQSLRWLTHAAFLPSLPPAAAAASFSAALAASLAASLTASFSLAASDMLLVRLSLGDSGGLSCAQANSEHT